MGIEDDYQNVEDIRDTFSPQTQNHRQAKGQTQKCRRSRCLVLMTVSLALICVLLLGFIVLQYITISSYKNTGWLFMSTEPKNWSDIRQYCMDHGADLVIINSKEKQRFLSSFATEPVWIGLSDREQEGNMKWVDNSPLNQGFWISGEPNDLLGHEDCVVMNAEKPNYWNDLSCSDIRNGICEKLGLI
ncbi:CD209 antigen-like protein 2 [Garra rufa]|uniref:CD209 antigen-like protein 2 n=1 Tax=Garra rufa TaxID=137080 RepID=UPI003CCE7F08